MAPCLNKFEISVDGSCDSFGQKDTAFEGIIWKGVLCKRTYAVANKCIIKTEVFQ